MPPCGSSWCSSLIIPQGALFCQLSVALFLELLAAKCFGIVFCTLAARPVSTWLSYLWCNSLRGIYTFIFAELRGHPPISRQRALIEIFCRLPVIIFSCLKYAYAPAEARIKKCNTPKKPLKSALYKRLKLHKHPPSGNTMIAR